MRPIVLASAMILSLAAIQAPARPPAQPTRLDHILLWGRGIDQATSVMAVKLGFQVRPGRDPGGVANRYVRLADSSFVELLGITRPAPAFDPGMKEDQQALKGGPGSRTFGFRSAALDVVYGRLRGLDYAVAPFFTEPMERSSPGGGCSRSIARRCRATPSSSSTPPATRPTSSIRPTPATIG